MRLNCSSLVLNIAISFIYVKSVSISFIDVKSVTGVS